jgi:hypothetical protein
MLPRMLMVEHWSRVGDNRGDDGRNQSMMVDQSRSCGKTLSPMVMGSYGRVWTRLCPQNICCRTISTRLWSCTKDLAAGHLVARVVRQYRRLLLQHSMYRELGQYRRPCCRTSSTGSYGVIHKTLFQDGLYRELWGSTEDSVAGHLLEWAAGRCRGQAHPKRAENR